MCGFPMAACEVSAAANYSMCVTAFSQPAFQTHSICDILCSGTVATLHFRGREFTFQIIFSCNHHPYKTVFSSAYYLNSPRAHWHRLWPIKIKCRQSCERGFAVVVSIHYSCLGENQAERERNYFIATSVSASDKCTTRAQELSLSTQKVIQIIGLITRVYLLSTTTTISVNT